MSDRAPHLSFIEQQMRGELWDGGGRMFGGL